MATGQWANAVLLSDVRGLLGFAGGAILAPLLRVDLYSARTAPPSATSSLADFTLFSDPPDTGYTLENITLWSLVALVAGHYQSVSNTFTFINSGLVNWTPALGYIIEDNAGAVYLGGVEFPAPITVGPGLSIVRQVTFDGFNEY